MRSYRLEKIGTIDNLVLREEELPSPGHGQILVRVRASSINFRDVAIVSGWFPWPVQDNRIPLSDGAGEIEAVGPGVNRFKAGDRVANAFYTNWFGGEFRSFGEQYFTDHDGWLTEYKLVDAEAMVALPDYLTFEEGATLSCAAVTAWSALAGIGAGDVVLTQGTGGVSLFAVQLAKALGAQVIATTSSPAKMERLRELGADHVIDYKANPEWGAEARALTGGRGIDRIVEVGGPSTLPQSIGAVAPGGQVSLIGILGGLEQTVDFMSLFISQARYQPITVGSRFDMEAMLRVMVAGAIKPVIDSSFAFDKVRTAWDHYMARDLFGKVVIRH